MPQPITRKLRASPTMTMLLAIALLGCCASGIALITKGLSIATINTSDPTDTNLLTPLYTDISTQTQTPSTRIITSPSR